MARVFGGFHWSDYIVFSLTVLVSLGIGIYFALSGGKQKTTNEYLMGDRQMSLLPVSVSMLVSLVSAIGILGNPVEVYQYGTLYMLYVVAAALGCIYGALLFVPLLYPLKLTSSFEYYEMRYHSKLTKLTGSFIALFNQIVFNGIQLFAPAVALAGVTYVPVWLTIIICGVAATIYTTIGGMKAVIWTDCFQCCIIFAGLLAIVIQGTISVGGLSKVWKTVEMWDRVNFLNFNPDPTVRLTVWSVVFMNSILWMALTATQTSVQRYSTLTSMTKARVAVLLNILGFFVFGTVTCYIGVVAFAYYAEKGCDPIRAKILNNPNQIIPYFVMEVLHYPGLPGLFVALLFSAALSSVSSSLNAMAAITWKDLLEPRLGHKDASVQATITKCLALGFGVLAIVVGFIVAQVGGTLIKIAYSIIGCTGGPIVGLFLVGGSLPRAGPKGVIPGAAIGFAFSLWLSIGASFLTADEPLPSPTYNCCANTTAVYAPGCNATDPGELYEVDLAMGYNMTLYQDPIVKVKRVSRLYAVSYMWYPLIGIVFVYIGGIISSLVPALQQSEETPDKFLFPFVRYIRHLLNRRRGKYDINTNELEKKEPFLADTKQEPDIDKKKADDI